MRSIFTLLPIARLAGFAPLVVRVIVGIIMAVHGWQKVTQVGPGNFGQGLLAELGIPFPVFMGYVVTFAELIGGILLIIGLLSRLAALVLTIDLVVAILLVKLNVGLIAPQSSGAGAELDLALIAGFLAILLAGPGRLSLDHLFGLEERAASENPLIKQLLSEKRADFFAFLATLVPSPVYVITLAIVILGFTEEDFPPVSGIIVPLAIGAFVAYASFRLTSLKERGLLTVLDELRQEKADPTDQNYRKELRGKIGETLTTLTTLGSISFAMVIFALTLLFPGSEQGQPSPFDQTTFSFIVLLLVVTAVMLLMTIESFDTALDPVWEINQIQEIRGFTGWTYSVALCFLVYTVAFAAFAVQPLLGLIPSIVFASLVHVYDRISSRAGFLTTPDNEQ